MVSLLRTFISSDSLVVAASGGTIFITRSWLVIRTEGARNLVLHGRQALEKRRDCLTVLARELCIRMPGIVGASSRPSGRLPLVTAVTISSSDHLPIPVSRSGVRFGPWNTPRPGISNPTSEPPRKRARSGLPKKYPGVWQSLQLPKVTRYLPRLICKSLRNSVARNNSQDGNDDRSCEYNTRQRIIGTGSSLKGHIPEPQ